MFSNRVAHGLKKPISGRKLKRQKIKLAMKKKQVAKENKELWKKEIEHGHYPDSMLNKQVA